MRPVGLLLGLAIGCSAGSLAAQFPEYDGPAYVRTELAPGVWAFVFDNPLGAGAGVDGTAVVIVNEHDVVVVDTQGSPATARRILAEIRKLTRNPVRYVVTTHWHGDHWFGNQVYQDAFPGVEFIAHGNALLDMDSEEIPTIDSTRLVQYPAILSGLEKRYATGIRRDGKPFSTADSATVRGQIAAFRWAIPAMKEVRPVRPTLLVDDSLTLRRGDRTIAIRFVGRGNTRGDLTVWLPRERVLVTGDLLVNPVPYSFGSYLSEWVATLGALRTLPARFVVPGHGEIQRDWAYLDLFVEMLRSTLEQTKVAVGRGLALDSTRKVVDLSKFRERFTAGDELRGRAFDAFYLAPAVERAWLEARGELEQAKH